MLYNPMKWKYWLSYFYPKESWINKKIWAFIKNCIGLWGSFCFLYFLLNSHSSTEIYSFQLVQRYITSLKILGYLMCTRYLITKSIQNILENIRKNQGLNKHYLKGFIINSSYFTRRKPKYTYPTIGRCNWKLHAIWANLKNHQKKCMLVKYIM